MAGPDHYLAAERLQRRMADLAEGQLHAVLALAAAVAIGGNLSGDDMRAWRDVAAVRN